MRGALRFRTMCGVAMSGGIRRRRLDQWLFLGWSGVIARLSLWTWDSCAPCGDGKDGPEVALAAARISERMLFHLAQQVDLAGVFDLEWIWRFGPGNGQG